MEVLVEGVELGADGVLEEGAVAGAEESLVDEAAGFSEDFFESAFESEEDSLALEESLELESELPELLGA